MSSTTCKMSSAASFITITILLSIFFLAPARARNRHLINFRSPNLFPESFKWDPKEQHFVLTSLRHPTIVAVSDAGIVETLITDPSLPANSSFLGLAIDRHHGNRILVNIHRSATKSTDGGGVFNALAAYDLTSRSRLFLTPLISGESSNPSDVANDVAVDFSGNAYVTNSGADMIWKVDGEGKPSVLSQSGVFKSHPVDRTAWYHFCGLNGVVYISKGYLLVVQSNTGKLYKVNVETGTARTVILNKELTAGDGIAVRRDGVVMVVSQQKLYYLKSEDSWGEGVVFDEITLEENGQASAVVAGEDYRVYVLYGSVNEGMNANSGRDVFSIVEVESDLDKQEDYVWIFVLIGLGLVYFLIWRFQMRKLFKDMNKKIA